MGDQKKWRNVWSDFLLDRWRRSGVIRMSGALGRSRKRFDKVREQTEIREHRFDKVREIRFKSRFVFLLGLR